MKFMAWGSYLALVLSIGVAYVLFHLLKKITPLLINGFFGMAIFWMLSYYGIIKVPLDIISFLIAAFGGVFGVIITVALAALGVPL